jgi:type I restriction enzyme S subunit
MSKWINCKIEDVCDFIGGSQPPKSTFIDYPKDGYTRLVQTRDFKTDKFPTYIPANSTSKFFNKADIIIGRYGPPIFQIFRGTLEGAYNVALMKAVPKENITNEFLYFFLTQKDVFEYVDKLSARTGGQTGVDLSSLYKYPINLPSKIEQNAITSVLSALNAKIELNNKINFELEAMAKTIYDYWFVQFDFPDKNGKPYKTSGGKMVWNEELKREIPDGWKVDSLSSWIAKDKSGDWGKEVREGNYSERVFCIRGADLNGLNGKGEVKAPERFILEKNSHKMLEPHDIIVEISGGGPTQSTGRMAYMTTESLARFDAPVICSNFCKAVTLKNEKSLYNFAFEWNKAYDHGILFGYEGKTSGIKNLLFESFVTSYQATTPTIHLMEKFYEFMTPFESRKQKNLLENQKLVELRDWLLPMLMNGQVRVI